MPAAALRKGELVGLTRLAEDSLGQAEKSTIAKILLEAIMRREQELERAAEACRTVIDVSTAVQK